MHISLLSSILRSYLTKRLTLHRSNFSSTSRATRKAETKKANLPVKLSCINPDHYS
jgi:hypothetical protein